MPAPLGLHRTQTYPAQRKKQLFSLETSAWAGMRSVLQARLYGYKGDLTIPTLMLCRDLERVYLELVVPGTIPEADFWKARRLQLARLGSAADGPRSQSAAQAKGLSNAMASDVRPAADGQTDTVHFSLTPEIIAQVRKIVSLAHGQGCICRVPKPASTQMHSHLSVCPAFLSRSSRSGPRCIAPTWPRCRTSSPKRSSGRRTLRSSTSAWRDGEWAGG